VGDEHPSGQQVSLFEQIRHEDEDGGEYWSARELAKALGYQRWEAFPGVIKKAEVACEGSGQPVADHFRQTTKMVVLGSGAEREIEDYNLSRYACYLIVQNADPSKEVVALGQTYFAVRTREAEIAAELAGLSESQRRLYVRDELTEHNKLLAATAQTAGDISPRDFAIFTDHGYMGLYNGEKARDIHARKGLKRGQQILDWMGHTELAANLFRATQAEDKIRREGITGKDAANQAHHEVGRKVRQTIAELGATMPEDLPTPTESVAQVRAREQKRLAAAEQAERQPSLFDGDSA
jgi:DNA-damage-inducible protein D